MLLLAMQATLTLSPFLTQKLNKLGSDLYGANGQQNTPRTTTDFIERLKNIFACKSPLGLSQYVWKLARSTQDV